MPTKQPALPAKKSAKKTGSSKAAPTDAKSLPVLTAQFITLEDGSQIPVKIPPGMSSEQAVAVLDYLKSNPEAAKAAFQQAQAVMARPGMAQAMFAGQSPAGAAAGAEMYEALKDDPDLAEVFADVKENGPSVLQKYWDDTDLMSKISARLRAVQISKQRQAGGGEGEAEGGKPGKPAAGAAAGAAAAAARKVETLHDAARWGDVEAAGRLIDEGADVNGKNERGIPALGVAVGFNQKEVVRLLLDRGADVAAADAQGSTALHYAAGYGRREVAALLLAAGADASATNTAGQKPLDVAKLNGEKKMAEWLQEQAQ
ncbi:hypothetical protein Rsub_09248 [Raphidocelis subcapitata]|uniref:Uncharacterized protein n=1 Tax=Raphidocelis subcapitata TaxID=307507 RepID=A0A2V0PA99_9CHLO|nr:hypothetical protein Rsub_09248 [Raphidocelis subcapitata]|eukprot:GBF96449.1 hypothetical protein Rsub_09248 [Raphidocelis subcapitata]